MSNNNANEPIAQLRANSFVSNPLNTIIKATMLGLMFVWLFSLIGAPLIFGMVGLFAGILLVYGYQAGKVQYSLYQNGIEQQIEAFIPSFLGRPARKRFVDMASIVSYRRDTEMKRNLDEYAYIKLYLNKRPKQIWITDQRDKEGFKLFADAFEKLVDFASVEPRQEIVKKKGFYDSLFAKILTVLFLFITGGLFYFGYEYGMQNHNWLRLALIIVPGTIYMTFRVFLAPSKEDAQ